MGLLYIYRRYQANTAVTAGRLVLPSRASTQVTKVFLIGSFHIGDWVPGTGEVFVHRMVKEQTPQNTVPCAMHGQVRCPPRVLGIIWCAFAGVWPGAARGGAIGGWPGG